MNYTLQRARQHGGDQFETDLPEHQGLYNSELEFGPPTGTGSTTSCSRWSPSCRSAEAAVPVRLVAGDGRIFGGWQFNANTTIQSGLPFNVTYRDAGADRDTGPNRPNLIGDPGAARNAGSMVQYRADRVARQRVRPASTVPVLATWSAIR